MLTWFSRPAVRIVLVALIVGGLGVLAVAPAFAHTALVKATPGDGESVAKAPSELTLQFNDAPLGQFTEITVTPKGGAALTLGKSTLDDATVHQPLPSGMAAGTYDVAWKVVAADGHPISGGLSFTVTEGEAPASGSGSSSASESASSGSSSAPAGSSSAATSGSASPSSTTSDDSGSSWPVWLGLGAGAVILAGLAAAFARRRNH